LPSGRALCWGLSSLTCWSYPLRAKLRFTKGMARSMELVWPELGRRIGFARDVPRLEVPVYLFAGREDRITDLAQVEGWFAALQAPEKKLEIVDRAGHLNLFEAPKRFVALLDSTRRAGADDRPRPRSLRSAPRRPDDGGSLRRSHAPAAVRARRRRPRPPARLHLEGRGRRRRRPERYTAGEQGPLEAARQDFAGIEGELRKAGFPGYAEFVRTNAKIAWAFNTAQGRAFLQDFAGRMSEAESELQKAIADPQVPEEAKRELRAQLKTLKAEYAKNKKWAEVSMQVAGRLTDPASVEVILRHRAQLEAVFQGQGP